MRILVIDTAYWGIISEAGLDTDGVDREARESIISEFLSTSPSAGPALARGLRALGHHVDLHLANAPVFTSTGESKGKRLLSNFRTFPWKRWQIISRVPLVGDLIFSKSGMGRGIIAASAQKKFDLIYVLNPNLTTPRVAKALKKNAQSIVGQIASPLPPLRFFRYYSLMLSAHPGQVEFFRSSGIPALYMPLAIDDVIISHDPTPHSIRTVDICFVGSFGRHHRSGTRLFQKLCAEFPQLKIYSLTSVTTLKRLGLLANYAGVAWGKKMMEIYSDARVVINRHGKVAGGYAVNYRMFEATAAGAMLLTEEAPNLPELFRPGVEVETYADFEELVEKIHRALSDSEWTQSVGFAGHSASKRLHSSKIRYRQLAEVLENLN